MKKALLLAAAALSLSSCHIYWNTGEYFKENTVTYTGANTSHPVSGIYQAPDGTFYMQALEVRYKLHHYVAGVTKNGLGPWSDPNGRHITDLEFTDRILWVQVDATYDKDGFHWDAKNGSNPRLVDALPAGSKALPYRTDRYDALPAEYTTWRNLGCFSTERSGWYWPACIVSVPLRYVVDPALTVVTTVAGYTGITCGYIIAAPFWLTVEATQRCQRTESVTTSK